MGLNIERLKQVKQLMLSSQADRGKLDMLWWHGAFDDNELMGKEVAETDRADWLHKFQCKTAHCMAGSVQVAFTEEWKSCETVWDASLRAARDALEFMGADREFFEGEHERFEPDEFWLFHLNRWPAWIARRYKEAKNDKGRARAAAAAVQHLIDLVEGGHATWEELTQAR